MLKKLLISSAAISLLFLTACSQKYDAVGPGITEDGQTPIVKSIEFRTVSLSDTVSNPKVVISEKFMYSGRQMDINTTSLTSRFLTDFTIPSVDSAYLDSVHFLYPLFGLPDTNQTLPVFNISKIYNNWNSSTDSLVSASLMDEKPFADIQLQKNESGYFSGVKYLLKFTINKDTALSWYNSQIAKDTTAHKFRGLAVSTVSDKLYKFYSPSYPSSEYFVNNFQPKVIYYYKHPDSANVKKVPYAFKKSASLVSRKSKFLTDPSLIKIGGVGGEGMLLEMKVQDCLPDDAVLLSSRLVLDRVSHDPVNGSLQLFNLYSLTDTLWKNNPQNAVDNKSYKLICTSRIASTNEPGKSFATVTDALIRGWKTNNFGFYLKSAPSDSNSLGYNIFKDVRFEVTYLSKSSK